MTRAQFEVVLEMAVYAAWWQVVVAAPIDTGNLAYNSIKLERTTTGYVIYVDSAIAPYMVYTEEPWISPYWRGKKNPNEGWFKRVAEDIAEYIRQIFNGEKDEEVNSWLDKYQWAETEGENKNG